eukprot:12102653-Alexandrium_andersonii.AAC.1
MAQEIKVLARPAQAIAGRCNSVMLHAQHLHCGAPVRALQPWHGQGAKRLKGGCASPPMVKCRQGSKAIASGLSCRQPRP